MHATIGSLFRDSTGMDALFVKKFTKARWPGRRRSFLSSSHLTVGAAVVLGRDGAPHGPRGWPASAAASAEREREREPHAAFPESRDDDWDVPLLTAWLTG